MVADSGPQVRRPDALGMAGGEEVVVAPAKPVAKIGAPARTARDLACRLSRVTFIPNPRPGATRGAGACKMYWCALHDCRRGGPPDPSTINYQPARGATTTNG